MKQKVHMGYYDAAVYAAVEQGIFEIDSRGRIWRLLRPQTSRWGAETTLVKCRRRAESRGRYLQLRLTVQGKRAYAFAHRIVFRHFKGPIPEGLTINHKNGNKHDNHPNNLEPATQSEQCLHAVRVLGYRPQDHAPKLVPRPGIKNPMAKLTDVAAMDIKSHQERGAGVRLAKKYGVSVATISRVRNGLLWGHVV